jgi:hypothetical protein
MVHDIWASGKRVKDMEWIQCKKKYNFRMRVYIVLFSVHGAIRFLSHSRKCFSPRGLQGHILSQTEYTVCLDYWKLFPSQISKQMWICGCRKTNLNLILLQIWVSTVATVFLKIRPGVQRWWCKKYGGSRWRRLKQAAIHLHYIPITSAI